MAIYKMMTLSTVHLTAKTCRRIDEWCASIDLTRRAQGNAPTLIGATDYGWIVYCSEVQDGLPDDLFAVLVYARKAGCEYVLFDADCDEIDDLPYHGGPAEVTADPAIRAFRQLIALRNGCFDDPDLMALGPLELNGDKTIARIMAPLLKTETPA